MENHIEKHASANLEAHSSKISDQRSKVQALNF